MDKHYNVFLSYNSSERASVENIASLLREANLEVFFDQWELIPGEPWMSALEDGLAKSDSVAVFVGPAGISPWHEIELRDALANAARDKGYRVIPVLLPGGDSNDIPSFLKQRTWVDLRKGVNDRYGLERLVSGIRGIIKFEPDKPIHDNSLKFIGNEDLINQIRLEFVRSSETPNFIIAGMHGSGRSRLLAFVANQFKSNPKWKFSSHTPQIIFIDGSRFGRNESFLKLLDDRLNRHFKSKWLVDNGDIPLAQSIAMQMNDITKDDIPILIMIDNFSRIMEYLSVEETRALNSLRRPGVSFFFVTDFRSLSEINIVAYSASSFFSEAIVKYLYPLKKTEIKMFLEDFLFSKELTLDEESVSNIISLAGGNPGLIRGVLRFLQTHHADEYLLNPSKGVYSSKMKEILRILPEGDEIKIHLAEAVSAFNWLLNNYDVANLLLEFAIKENANNMKVEAVIERKLNMMGLINVNYFQSPCKLYKYLILQNITSIQLSRSEEQILKILKTFRPRIVSLERLQDEMSRLYQMENKKELTAIVAREVRKLRKKLSATANGMAYNIVNVRGRGYYLTSMVTFDSYYEDGLKAFRPS